MEGYLHMVNSRNVCSSTPYQLLRELQKAEEE